MRGSEAIKIKHRSNVVIKSEVNVHTAMSYYQRYAVISIYFLLLGTWDIKMLLIVTHSYACGDPTGFPLSLWHI